MASPKMNLRNRVAPPISPPARCSSPTPSTRVAPNRCRCPAPRAPPLRRQRPSLLPSSRTSRMMTT
eukprot:1574177-Prymnesium_polylepis.1